MNISIKELRQNIADVGDQVHYTGTQFTVTKFGKPWFEISRSKPKNNKNKKSRKLQESEKKRRVEAFHKLLNTFSSDIADEIEKNIEQSKKNEKIKAQNLWKGIF